MMKKEKLFLKLIILGVILFHGSLFAAPPKGCFDSKDSPSLLDFKKLYVDLQQKLNYEGTDASYDKENKLDKKWQVKTSPHAAGTPYPGKEFEAAMFKEYQNSLRKVGRLFQAGKFEGQEDFKSNPLLVDFMAAIDNKKADGSSEFLKSNDIDKVMKALSDASQKFAKSPETKQYVITKQDEYLIRKLLTHSQDRICNIEAFNKTGKGLTKEFTPEYLRQVKNAPLNRLLHAIKSSSINKDSKIDLTASSPLTAKLMDRTVDEGTTVDSAIADNLQALSQWVQSVKAKNPKCFDYLKTKEFANSIQANIQSCNLNKFLDTISEGNYSNIEAVLHFINANERFLNNPQAKAETALDEVAFEGFINNTFSNLASRVVCEEIENNLTGDKKRFIRNLPYNQETNTFDKSRIICTANKKVLSASDCLKQYDLVSDALGRGLELRSKKTNLKNVTISVDKNSSKCSDISLDEEDSSTGTTGDPGLTSSGNACDKITNKMPYYIYIFDDKANTCSAMKCEDYKKDGASYAWNEDKKSCLPSKCDKSADGKDQKWDDAKKSCVLDDKKPDTAEEDPAKACAAQKKENYIFIYEATKIPSCQEVLCTDYKPNGVAHIWKEGACVEGNAGGKCPDSTKEGFISFRDPKTNECSEIKCEDKKDGDKKFKMEGKECVEVKPDDKKEDTKEKECAERQKKLNDAGEFGIKWKWNSDKKECVDMKPAKKDDDDEGEEGAGGPQRINLPYKQPPGRFQPIGDGGGRRQYVLPGSW